MDQELLRICTILKDNGIDVSSIATKKTIDGKRYYVVIKDIKSDDSNIDEIIKSNDLNGDWPIGKHISKFRLMYNGTIKNRLSDEQKRMAEELGLVKAPSKDRQEPLIKGGKVSDFHISIVKENLDKILNGELSNREVIRLINRRAILEDETEIKDSMIIKKIVSMLLFDKPEELKKYNEMLKNSHGKRNLSIGKSDEFKGKSYMQGVLEFKSKITSYYLPLYLSHQVSIETMRKELHTSSGTIDRVIEEYYNNDEQGLEAYRKAKKDNCVATTEKIENSRKMKEEIEGYKIVPNAEFESLSEEEQDKQIIMKIRKMKLNDDKKRGRNKASLGEKTNTESVKRIKEYFRRKNKSGKINFSEKDIRHMIFISPTLINYKSQTLDEKFENILSYDEISEENAYKIARDYPEFFRSSIQRVKNQLDILEKEKLMDCIINNPRRLIVSPELMYALIKYAKERHGTEDLSNVNINSIFMANSTMKKMYGVTHEEIKERFPYNEAKEDEICNIDGQRIGQASFNIEVEMCDNIQGVLSSSTMKDIKVENLRLSK